MKQIFSSMLLCCVCLFAQTEDAAAEPGRWTPELIMKYKSIQDTAVSPDGRMVAYVVRQALMEGEKSEYLSHIWVYSKEEKTTHQYTRGEHSANNPAFSPDGTWLSFLSKRGEHTQIWIMRMRGGEARQLTNAENSISQYKWSPDGGSIAFLMSDPETEEEKQRTKEKRDIILVDREFKYRHIYKIDVNMDVEEETKAIQLTQGNFFVTDLDWAPDSRNLAFSHQPDPRIEVGLGEKDIATVSAAGGPINSIVDWAGIDRAPIFSPDGQWIAFISDGGSPERVGLGDVFIVPSRGGTPQKLAETPDRNPSPLGWSGDGSKFYVQEAVRTARHVIEVPVKGNASRVVTSGDGCFTSVSLSKDANWMAFVYQDLDLVPDVYLSRIDGSEKVRCSNVNEEIDQPRMGGTELLTWHSKDGMEIEGLLTYPVDYTKGRAYPLILNVHGGPAGVFSRDFTGDSSIYMIQFFAQNGYAVLRPNPRGSTGYGKTFRYANYRDWGGGDYQDLMSGVDTVIEMGVADPDQLCVMGWSYGGYMSSMIVTKTQRFKAASMGAGLPNMISMVNTTDIPGYIVAHFGGEYWEDYEIYAKLSAVHRISEVTTPTQILHGERDVRVPIGQGREFYTSLDRRGVPTEMVIYPRTPHGPREPKLLMDVSPRIMKWFDHHLGRDQKVAESEPGAGETGSEK